MRRTHFIQRTLSVLTGLLLAVAVSGLSAQSPTPEGTVITNTSTVTYTDANGNSYTPVTASVSVTVGFVAGVDLTGAVSVNPATPSSGNVLSFTYQNIGNGNDSITVSQTNTVPGTMVITGYQINGAGPVYASLAALNAALASTLVAQNANLVINVIYDVPSGRGGLPSDYTMTATSRRDNLVNDSATTQVAPNLAAAVAVTPDGGQNLQLLPSNLTNYSFTFTVQNNGNGPDNFTLVGSNPGSALTIVSVNGTPGTSGSITGLAPGGTQSVVVVYTVLNVAAGSTDNLVLTATSVGNPGVSDAGFADITVIKPSLAMVKEVFRDDATTVIAPADRVLPGEFIRYRITVTNNGSAPSTVVQITDNLPAQLTYNAATGDLAGWTFSNTGNNVTADLTGSLAPAASRFIWIRAQVN